MTRDARAPALRSAPVPRARRRWLGRRGIDAALLKPSRVADEDARARDDRLRAEPMRRLELARHERRQRLPFGARDDCARQSDAAIAPRPRRRSRTPRGGLARPTERSRRPRPAVRQRARLVERDRSQPRQALQMDAALDQHAAAGRGGQADTIRDRRRDHERAGAGDHQQHQRAIQPSPRRPTRRAAARSPPAPPARSRPACRPARTDRRRPARARAAPAPPRPDG